MNRSGRELYCAGPLPREVWRIAAVPLASQLPLADVWLILKEAAARRGHKHNHMPDMAAAAAATDHPSPTLLAGRVVATLAAPGRLLEGPPLPGELCL